MLGAAKAKRERRTYDKKHDKEAAGARMRRPHRAYAVGRPKPRRCPARGRWRPRLRRWWWRRCTVPRRPAVPRWPAVPWRSALPRRSALPPPPPAHLCRPPRHLRQLLLRQLQLAATPGNPRPAAPTGGTATTPASTITATEGARRLQRSVASIPNGRHGRCPAHGCGAIQGGQQPGHAPAICRRKPTAISTIEKMNVPRRADMAARCNARALRMADSSWCRSSLS